MGHATQPGTPERPRASCPPRYRGLILFAQRMDALSERVGTVVCWLTLAMVAIGSYNAVARYLGRYVGVNLSSNAYLELQWYLFSAVFLLGASYALRHNAHVRVDVVFDRLAPRTRAWVDLAGTAACLLPFCVLMLWALWAPVRNSWAVLEMSPDPGGLPRYPVRTLMPIAFVLLLLQGVAEALKQVAFLKGLAGDPAERPGKMEV